MVGLEPTTPYRLSVALTNKVTDQGTILQNVNLQNTRV